MNPDADASLPTRFSSHLTPWLVFGWTAAVLSVWLFRYDAVFLPVQFLQLAGATLPTLRIGPYFGELWSPRLGDAVFLAGLFAAAFGVGAVPVSKLTGERGLLAALFALAVGLWLVAAAVLMIGTVSVAQTGWVLTLLATWWLPAPREFVRRWRGERWDGWTAFFLALMVAAAVLNLPGALLPPFEYDELVYHLGAPGEYIKAGRIVALPHNFYSDLPQLTEMLYLLAMVARSDVAAKLLHWSFGLLTAVAVYAVAARLWSRRVGMTAAAVLYCLPFVQELSQTARIDLATTFFGTLAFGGLLVDGGDRRWRWLSALAAGCAVATKWPAVAVVLLPAAGFVAWTTRSVRQVVVFGFLACVPVGPWLVKNLVLTGNPVYPLLTGLMPSPHWSAAQTALFVEKHAPRFDAEGWRQLWSLVGQYSFIEPGATPVLLVAAPLLWLWRGQPRATRQTGGLLGGAYAGWFLLTFRPWRFLFPAFPLAAMLTACAAQRRAVRWVVASVVALGLVRMTLSQLIDVEDYKRVPPAMNAVQYSLGEISREEFVARMGGGIFEPVIWMNHHLPANAKVVYLGEARVYYEKFPVVWSTAFDQHPLTRWANESADADALWKRLRREGITHVYINHYELERLGRNYGYLKTLNWPMVNELLDRHARVVHRLGPYVVYALEG